MIYEIMKYVGIYLIAGLFVMALYIWYVGLLIHDKYECGIFEGMCRFIIAGDLKSNVRATLETMVKWPKFWWLAVNGTWCRVLYQMVEENEYPEVR